MRWPGRTWGGQLPCRASRTREGGSAGRLERNGSIGEAAMGPTRTRCRGVGARIGRRVRFAAPVGDPLQSVSGRLVTCTGDAARATCGSSEAASPRAAQVVVPPVRNARSQDRRLRSRARDGDVQRVERLGVKALDGGVGLPPAGPRREGVPAPRTCAAPARERAGDASPGSSPAGYPRRRCGERPPRFAAPACRRNASPSSRSSPDSPPASSAAGSPAPGRRRSAGRSRGAA